ncbi:MAG TPA: aldo/keto reductase, partial [Stellaceae bacterium]|nr:aldo/keto reductase [Stellaceae bacterium]
MNYIDIKGARVPALGLGTWQLSGRGCFEAVRQALDLGYRHIDTAQMYGNETEVGWAIRESGVARDLIFLTTKLAPGNLAAAAAKRSTEESLRRLATDHVDLLLIHWPTGEAPLGETLGALAALRKAGKTRFIGVSNFNVALLQEAAETHGADLLCNQVEYHPYLSQRAVLAAVRRHGVMLTAYSPLARGRVQRDAALTAIGHVYGKSPAQAALRWLLDQDGVAAIPKATSRAHLAANLAVFDFRAERAGPHRDRRAPRRLPRRRSRRLGARLGRGVRLCGLQAVHDVHTRATAKAVAGQGG